MTAKEAPFTEQRKENGSPDTRPQARPLDPVGAAAALSPLWDPFFTKLNWKQISRKSTWASPGLPCRAQRGRRRRGSGRGRPCGSRLAAAASLWSCGVSHRWSYAYFHLLVYSLIHLLILLTYLTFIVLLIHSRIFFFSFSILSLHKPISSFLSLCTHFLLTR